MVFVSMNQWNQVGIEITMLIILYVISVFVYCICLNTQRYPSLGAADLLGSGSKGKEFEQLIAGALDFANDLQFEGGGCPEDQLQLVKGVSIQTSAGCGTARLSMFGKVESHQRIQVAVAFKTQNIEKKVQRSKGKLIQMRLFEPEAVCSVASLLKPDTTGQM